MLTTTLRSGLTLERREISLNNDIGVTSWSEKATLTPDGYCKDIARRENQICSF